MSIPLGSFTVICGLSGSGKSSLAFETLYAEGQRRYLQNFSHYVKQYLVQQTRPKVEEIRNLPPALALEQKNNVRSARSTVATLSGLADHLRLLFEKRGVPFCPEHKTPLEGFSPDTAADYLLKRFSGERAFLLSPVLKEQIAHPKTFLDQLRKAGLSRLIVPGPKGRPLAKIPIKNASGLKRLPGKDFFILMDRLAVKEAEKPRLVDSLTQSFQIQRLIPSERKAFSGEAVFASLEGEERRLSRQVRCPHCRFELPAPLTAALFNYNSPLGACPECEGYGCALNLDERKVIPYPRLSLKDGAVHPFNTPTAAEWKKKMKGFCAERGIGFDTPWCDLSLSQRKAIWDGSASFQGINGYFQFLEAKKYKMHIRILLARYRSPFPCGKCRGGRLRKEAGFVLFHGQTFNSCMKMTLRELRDFFETEKFSALEEEACRESFQALRKGLKYLNAAGLSYLSLSRSARSLSGGEFQRLNLSNQLGLSLSQVLYVLDEPTVGLHARDTARVIEILKEIRDMGNTVVVVEHDQGMIENSDFVIEMGPGSGKHGGRVLWAGPKSEFLESESSNTAGYLRTGPSKPGPVRPTDKENFRYSLRLKGCSARNLKKIDLFVPLNRFVAVTGVSGSGKTSLITDTLYPALEREIKGGQMRGLDYGSLSGAQFLQDAILMDQKGMRKNSRSFIASYIKIFDLIRQSFAEAPLAKREGFGPSHFSLNVDGGRCPNCRGLGFKEIDMVFMDPLTIRCEDCGGRKFRKEILRVKSKGKSIFEVLNLTVEEAVDFFRFEAPALRAFSALREVGLSYLALGQSVGSLSGGERQRLKLARELLGASQRQTLYILDEPTKGLHFREIELLLKVINRLVEGGGSVVVIEHNLDVIKEADYIIDVGPEAGAKGGRIVAEGPPLEILSSGRSHTARCLKAFLARSGGGAAALQSPGI